MSTAQLDRLVDANDAIASMVQAELNSALSRIDFSNPQLARAQLFELVPPLVDKWGSVASAAAAEWFEEFRLVEGLSGSYRATLAAPVLRERVTSRLGFATREAGHLFAGQDAMLAEFLSLMVNEYALEPGHATIMENTHRSGAAYARVPEPGACTFCLMLASRGFVYSKQTVTGSKDGQRFHGFCRCHGMPVWDETKARVVYGYDPDRLERDYQAARNEGEGDISSTLKEWEKAL